ncbi:nuclear transport factor 2 family protein [Pelagibius sp. 7325]|uniref:nuclear transport factor 2 family protein n=1 Tax=Pelagibius sp. 7325 TaxID=3131994 RepID=UPI0030EC0DEE
MTAVSAAAERYIVFLETMTPATLERLEELCAPEVHFCDPFNDVTGVAGYRRVMAKMFDDVGQPEFVVTGKALAGECLYLRWSFSARGPGGRPLRFEGMSAVDFDAAGRVIAHRDFWDAGKVYEKIPVLRSLIGFVKRRLSVD